MWSLLLVSFIAGTSGDEGPFPVCSDPSTYTVYTRDTTYKALHNTLPYDDDNHIEGCIEGCTERTG